MKLTEYDEDLSRHLFKISAV